MKLHQKNKKLLIHKLIFRFDLEARTTDSDFVYVFFDLLVLTISVSIWRMRIDSDWTALVGSVYTV